MQPEQLAEVRAWLQKAAADLRGARVDLDAVPPLVEDSLFHGQQAVEKVLKAFLTAHDRVFPKTHDLDVLSTACESVDPELRGVLDPARDLSVFAWQFRYPGETEVPPKEEAESVLRIARSVFDAIVERLPRDATP